MSKSSPTIQAWERRHLDDLVNFDKGRIVATHRDRRISDTPYIGVDAFGGEFSAFTSDAAAVLSEVADVLMLWDGERSGLVTTGLRGAIGSTVARLRPTNGVDGRFLYHQLDRHFAWIQARRTGTGVPHVPKDLGKLLHLDVPESEAEQRRIAAVLDLLDSAIAKTEAVIAKLRSIRAGLLHDLLTRGLDANGQLRDPLRHPEQFKPSPLGMIPKGWEVKTLDELLARVPNAMRSGPFGSSLLKQELKPSGIPLLGIDNVHVEYFDATFTRFVAEDKFHALRRYSVRPRDVMITVMGTVGRCCVVPNDIGDALSSKHVWTMTLDHQEYLPELACWQMNHAEWVLRQLRRDEQGGIMSAIRSGTLRKLCLPVPATVEQEVISTLSSTMSNTITAEQGNAAKLSVLKAGLMSDLLSGRVRVRENRPYPGAAASEGEVV